VAARSASPARVTTGPFWMISMIYLAKRRLQSQVTG
jgi:hypothetical protein